MGLMTILPLVRLLQMRLDGAQRDGFNQLQAFLRSLSPLSGGTVIHD